MGLSTGGVFTQPTKNKSIREYKRFHLIHQSEKRYFGLYGQAFEQCRQAIITRLPDLLLVFVVFS